MKYWSAFAYLDYFKQFQAISAISLGINKSTWIFNLCPFQLDFNTEINGFHWTSDSEA